MSASVCSSHTVTHRRLDQPPVWATVRHAAVETKVLEAHRVPTPKRRLHVARSSAQPPAEAQNLERTTTSTAGRVQADQLPCLAGGGGGIFFFWQLGAIKYLQKHYDMDRMQFVGASAGALVVTVAACRVDPDQAVERAYRISEEERLWERRLGLLGIWGRLIRRWLDDILPADAHERCRGRLKLVVTDVWGRKQDYVHDIQSREDMIQANMCSIHIPFFLDLRPFQYYKGTSYVDGSLTDFLFWENGELLTMEGRSFVLDYSRDPELEFSRLDFVKLRSYESVLELVAQGYAYAQRLDAEGGFDRFFGSVRL